MHTISACGACLEARVTQYVQKESFIGIAAQWKEHMLLLGAETGC